MSLDTDTPLSIRLPIARLELYSARHNAAVTDELDATSKALLVEFSWADLSPPPPRGQRTVYTLEWDEKPILLPTLDDEAWEWDAPIEAPSEIVYEGGSTEAGDDEETVLALVLIPGTEPHIPRVFLREKHDATAAIAPAELGAEEKEKPSPLEIPVKTLSPTYPLSSEFLGANYRYIADLIMREVETSPGPVDDTSNKTKGILHTVFAVRRLEELRTLKTTKQRSEEKSWIEREFGVTLERLYPNAEDKPNANDSLVGSPTASAKEWTSQMDLAMVDEGDVAEREEVPWIKPGSPAPTTAAATSGIKPIHPSAGATVLSGLGLVTTGFAEIALQKGSGGGVFDAGFSDVPAKKGAADEGEEEEEEDLFQLPLSPRSPDLDGSSGAFAVFKGDATTQQAGAKIAA